MSRHRLRSVTALVVAFFAASAAAVDVVGMLAGRIVDRSTGAPLRELTVRVRSLETGAGFEATTDASGMFFVPNLPADMYAFSIADANTTYEIDNVFDVRVGMPFVWESCFELDTTAQTASPTTRDCTTRFVPEARVVAVGAQRFLVPETLSLDWRQSPTGLPTVEHEPLECVPGDEFPMLEARIDPPDVQAARLFFRAAQHQDTYFVDMSLSPEDGRFYGVLPKATVETTQIHYYVEAIDREFDTARTAEFVADVSTADDCQRRGPTAWFSGTSPGVVVHAISPGAPAIPAGFQATGIIAFVTSTGLVTSTAGAAAGAGGGLTTTGLILVVGGVGAGAGGLIAVATDGDEASPPDP